MAPFSHSEYVTKLTLKSQSGYYGVSHCSIVQDSGLEWDEKPLSGATAWVLAETLNPKGCQALGSRVRACVHACAPVFLGGVHVCVCVCAPVDFLGEGVRGGDAVNICASASVRHCICALAIYR
jgi:hypothetical protein